MTRLEKNFSTKRGEVFFEVKKILKSPAAGRREIGEKKLGLGGERGGRRGK